MKMTEGNVRLKTEIISSEAQREKYLDKIEQSFTDRWEKIRRFINVYTTVFPEEKQKTLEEIITENFSNLENNMNL